MKKKLILLVLLFSSSHYSFGQPFIGEIKLFAGNFAPRDWAFCEGQLLLISQNEALFSILGTMYGGNGSTTFALPDLRSRTPVGPGYGPGLDQISIGEKGGNYQLYISTSNLPPHKHTGYINITETEGNSYFANEGYIADTSKVQYKQFTNVMPNGSKKINGVETDNTGGGQALSSRNPYTGIHYIICLSGTYPSRP